MISPEPRSQEAPGPGREPVPSRGGGRQGAGRGALRAPRKTPVYEEIGRRVPVTGSRLLVISSPVLSRHGAAAGEGSGSARFL